MTFISKRFNQLPTFFTRRTVSEFWMRRFAAAAFVFLGVFESWVVGVDYAGYFARLIEIEQPFFSSLAFLGCILSIFLSYRLLKFALSASPGFKVILFGLMAISMIVEYGYQKALGRFSDPADLETALRLPNNRSLPFRCTSAKRFWCPLSCSSRR